MEDRNHSEAYSCPVSAISGATQEKARRELGEVPEQRLEFVERLRDRIDSWKPNEDDEIIPNFTRQDDDRFLLAFLRARKFDLDKALQLYVNYHLYRHKHANIIGDQDPSSVSHVFKSGMLGVLDERLYNGSKVLCIYPERWDYVNVPFIDNFRATLMVLDRLIEDEETQVHGISVLYNFEGSSFYSMLKVTQSDVIKNAMLIELLQDAFPARIKAVHIMHQPWYVSLVLTIIRPFMKQKLRDRIHMHGSDFESLHKHANPEHLPVDFGGKQPLMRRHSSMELFPGEFPQVSE